MKSKQETPKGVSTEHLSGLLEQYGQLRVTFLQSAGEEKRAVLENLRHTQSEIESEQMLITLERSKQHISAWPKQKPKHLPQTGEYIFYLLLPKKDREQLLGDLAEEYQQIVTHFGARPAKLWFYKQVLTSLWPMMQATGRTLAKWGLLGWLEEVIRHIAH